jgi:hypothetical protein
MSRAGQLLDVNDLADVVGGRTEQHGVPVERKPVREPVGQLPGDVVHGPQVRGQSGRGVEPEQQLLGP